MSWMVTVAPSDCVTTSPSGDRDASASGATRDVSGDASGDRDRSGDSASCARDLSGDGDASGDRDRSGDASGASTGFKATSGLGASASVARGTSASGAIRGVSGDASGVSTGIEATSGVEAGCVTVASVTPGRPASWVGPCKAELSHPTVAAPPNNNRSPRAGAERAEARRRNVAGSAAWTASAARISSSSVA